MITTAQNFRDIFSSKETGNNIKGIVIPIVQLTMPKVVWLQRLIE